MDQKIDRMKELVDKLNEASRVYYQGKDEIMSNIEYDKLYDELQTLEEETGTVMNNSPTIHVGYETLSELPKEAHIPFYPKKATCLIKEALDKASELEVDYLGGVLHSGIGVFSGKQRTQEEENTLCEVWAEVAEYAARSGITIGIEPINRYESYMCTSAEEVLRFIKRVNAPNLSLHLDTFHMNIEETSFYEPVIAAGSRLRHIHMTESDRGMLGEGNVRWDDLFRGLQEIDFNGNLVLENFSNSVPGMAEAVSLWRPSKYNADALAKGSLAFMRKMAREYQ